MTTEAACAGTLDTAVKNGIGRREYVIDRLEGHRIVSSKDLPFHRSNQELSIPE